MSLYYWGRFEEAAKASADYCFPNRLEAVLALKEAMAAHPSDAKAPYYLGNLYYDKRQYDIATALWEQSASLDPSFPTVWRNLALSYYNKFHDPKKAEAALAKAFYLDTSDSRVLMELDQLYKKLGRAHKERLAFLESYPEQVARRDDLILEKVTLLNQLGRYDEAKALLDSHIFHPWEGGEGKVPAQYQFARVLLAHEALSEGRNADAVRLLEECLEYPHHLGEGKLYGAQENDFYYLLGVAYDGMGEHERAVSCWKKASLGNLKPAAALYYNDAKPEKIFYQGLALQKLNLRPEAESRFHELVEYGCEHLDDHVVMDYFAVSLPDFLIWEDDLDAKNRIHCYFMQSLGLYGLGHKDESRRILAQALELDPNHMGLLAFKSLFF